ncbi:DUF6978 family protein [Faecalimicrobium sp. JNUCC 81]
MLTQDDFTQLMQHFKTFEDNSPIVLPDDGGKIARNLHSKNSNDQFILNIERGRIDLKKVKYQTRDKATNTVLLRIDTKGPRHLNPDGEFIECPHIHIYKENYGDKWAIPLDATIFSDFCNLSNLLRDFLIYFNVQDIPTILSVEKMV